MARPPSPTGEVVGWGSKARWSDADAFTVSSLCGRELAGLGVEHAFGVLGGGVAGFADGLVRHLRLFHTRHEAGAAFSAVEAHFASGRPVVVVVTTGPGLWNALTGLMAARADGAKVLVVSGATARPLLGRGAVQETGPGTASAHLTSAGPLFHLAAQPESIPELRAFFQQLASGWSRPAGFVAHLALTWTMQTALCDPSTRLAAPWSQSPPAPTEVELDAILAELGRGPAGLWVGHGCRAAAAPLRRFAERAHLPVVSSPRAKGVFPEEHPLFVGVSGAGGHPTVPAWFTAHRPDTLLVLGTRLGEVTSFLSDGVTPGRGFVHVDVDPTAFAAGFPGVPGRGVVADCGALLTALDARAEATGWYHGRGPRPLRSLARPERLAPRPGDVRPAFLMQAVQDVIVDGSDAVVASEAGNSFTWCNHALRFASPGRYRTSAAWGSMGHFTAGAVGGAVASGRRTVAVVGDGAMLMNNEVNTAVAYRAEVMWIVLNDAQLGLNEHGMGALGMRSIETQLPRTDFAAFARCQGATGFTVTEEAGLAGVLATALATPGPVVVDVRVDRTVPSPILAQRTRSLEQGAP